MREKQAANPINDLPKTSAPAQRALDSVGIATLSQLSNFRHAEIAKLHGMGPKALGILAQALAAKGLNFADETPTPVAKESSN